MSAQERIHEFFLFEILIVIRFIGLVSKGFICII
nr:hypothetical protein WMHIBSEC_WMHIBSEC_CDS_0066 [Caudoviricetes sp.]CAI9751816.1 hypothetical protein AZFZUZMX_AZFZUZMX_CDS_0066 [Caudoviricetes sp.]